MKSLWLNSQMWCKIKPSQSLAVQSLNFYLPNLFDDQFNYTNQKFLRSSFYGKFLQDSKLQKKKKLSSVLRHFLFSSLSVRKKKRFGDITRGIFAVYFDKPQVHITCDVLLLFQILSRFWWFLRCFQLLNTKVMHAWSH